jgi:transcriptional regulator with XRE-family HTH domain
LPFTRVVRKAGKDPRGEPRTIGDHVRQARQKRRLLQREVAELIDVTPETVANWEKNKTEPVVALMPAVIRFLGYEPWPEPVTQGERLRAWRMREGLSFDEVARRYGIDERTWAGWEAGRPVVQERHRTLLHRLIGSA